MRLETIVDVFNSTSTPLGVGGTFTGQWSDTRGFGGITVGLKADANGKLYVDFSPDGVHVDSTITFDVDAGIRETHRLTVSNKFYRVRVENDGSPQTYMRLQSMLGWPAALSSPLNQSVQLDADAQTVRTVDPEIALARGLFTGISVVNKFGRIPSINSGTGLSVDCWGGASTYTGFPASAQLAQVLSSDANDTAAGSGARTIVITGLDADYNIINETITLSGTTPVNSTQQFLRVHTARIATSGGATANANFNAGTITVRQATTTTNVFLSMQPGFNQTQCSAYTVPAGYTGYVKRLHGTVRGSTTTAHVDFTLWVRLFGSSPRLRRPSAVNFGGELDDNIYGGLSMPEKTDIIARVTSVSANNTDVSIGYDIVLVQNND